MGVDDTGEVFHKTKFATTIRPSNYTPGLFAQRNENLCSHKNLYINVYKSLIHNSQKLETTQMSFKR